MLVVNWPSNQLGDGPYGYANKLIARFHVNMKTCMRSAIGLAHKKFWPAIKACKEDGWTKDHVKADLESFDLIAEIMKHPLNIPQMNGWKDEEDGNYKMIKRLFEMKAVVQEKDGFYDMLILLHYKFVHDNWHRYEASAEEAHRLFNFPKQYEALIAHYQAMKEPLPDITNEPDDVAVDKLVEQEMKANGLEYKR